MSQNSQLSERLADLPPMNVAARLPRLHEALADEDCDAFIITNLTNIRWLSGFTGSAGTLVVSKKSSSAILITDGRYAFQATEETSAQDVEVQISTSVAEQRELLKAAIDKTRSKRIGLEAEHVSWSRQQLLADMFSSLRPLKVMLEKLPWTRTQVYSAMFSLLEPLNGVVEKLRRSKDPGEIARIEAAAEIADASLEELLPQLSESVRSGGMTEQEFAAAHDHQMRLNGASEQAFETIVAAGSNGARPHARPGARAIQPGELVVIDSGAVVDGYRSDMTRTVSVGEPSKTAQRMWQVVQESQQAGVEAVKLGATTGQIDKICRDIIQNAGWGEAFMHSTGHGVGLDIHEIPGVSANTEEILREGEVITVEPGIYLPEHGGVRIEDTVSVTATGCRPLTKTPKVLVI